MRQRVSSTIHGAPSAGDGLTLSTVSIHDAFIEGDLQFQVAIVGSFQADWGRYRVTGHRGVCGQF